MTTPADNIVLLAEHIPLYCQRFLHVGCGDGYGGLILQGRGPSEVHGVEWDAERTGDAATRLAQLTIAKPESFTLTGMSGYFDCIIFSRTEEYAHRFTEVLQNAATYLAPEGCIFFTAPKIAVAPRDIQSLAAATQQANFLFYNGWDVSERTDRPSGIVVAVKQGYDPLAHARRLLQNAQLDNAFDILENIPEHLLDSDELVARVECEKQLCVFYWEEQADPAKRLHRFYFSQMSFYKAVAHSPGYPAPYHMQAEMWRRIGNPDMAARILRSLQHAYPHQSTEERLAKLGPVPAMAARPESAPRWQPGDKKPRLLFFTHKHTDYGLDVLYDGLCELLGDENVVEYPWKPGLHGMEPEQIKHYPCLFNRAGAERSLEELEDELRQGRFDAILFGSLEQDTDAAVIQRLTAAGRDVPIYIVDQQDDPHFNLQVAAPYLGRDEVAGYFKREMLDCVEYPQHTWPLPFAYPLDRIPKELATGRNEDVFWAGFPDYGLRRLYLDRVEQIIGRQFPKERLTQEVYANKLMGARIGLDFFGGGFDTVRYWELAAHGCMVLAERKPLRIPDNFRHGESAVFFDDLPQLEDLLRYYLAHTEEAAAIAAAGRQHLIDNHTGAIRASQLLARLSLEA